MGNLMMKAYSNVTYGVGRVQNALASKKGEAYIDSGVKILIAIVIGALLLAALYFLFIGNGTAANANSYGDGSILDRLKDTLTSLFNFKGATGNTALPTT